MNVLLVRPRPDPRTINLQSFMICEPLELEYVAAYLERFGHSVRIIDLILETKPLIHFLREFRPALVGFTGYLPHINVIKALAAESKRFDPALLTVVGGVHATVRPQDFDDRHIDHCLGQNSLEAMLALADGKSPEDAAPSEDAHPDRLFPDRAKTARYRKKYRYIFHDRCATIKTSFGCPYHCQFCFCTRVTDGRYSCRGLSSVMDELAGIRESNVFIVDDNFLADEDRVEAFCRLLKERGISKRFIVFGRADFIAGHPGTIRLLKSAGLIAVFVGIESFTQRELENFDKRGSVEMNLSAVRVLEENGILCYGGLMVGQDWDKADFDALIARLNGFRYPLVNVQPATPIPGTPFYDRMRGEIGTGLERCEIWDMAHVLLKPLRMSEREYYRHIMRVYTKTSLRPRVQCMILRRFGPMAYLRAAWGAWRISRQYAALIRKGCVFHA